MTARERIANTVAARAELDAMEADPTRSREALGRARDHYNAIVHTSDADKAAAELDQLERLARKSK